VKLFLFVHFHADVAAFIILSRVVVLKEQLTTCCNITA